MCGIAGFNHAAVSENDISSVLTGMGSAIRHRGPDASAQYKDNHINLCHQRLSVIDTSDHGIQPMHSPSGRFVTVYNGEIYNFLPLRAELEAKGVQFKGNSDTEVLLALYEQDGENCLSKLNGMFAFAIWDKQEKSLFLARDRLGKKPLYIWRQGSKLAFASEIKALLVIPDVKRTLRFDAVKDFFTYQYVPDPKSIFEDIEKLAPGHCMHISASNEVRSRKWWDISFQPNELGCEEEKIEHLHDLIEDSVKLRMISDVPLGAFLSGGVDSSAMVGFMAKNSTNPVTTCSVGFESETHDESSYARVVADLFDTDHKEFKVGGDVSDSLKSVARYFDEPFADASFLPTFFVCQMARQAVTVALAGDGGDESFAGYTKYSIFERELRWRSKVPERLFGSAFASASRLLSGSGFHNLQRASNLLRSLGANDDTGFFICNSFFREDLWNKLAKGDLASETSNYHASENTCRHFNNADTDDPMSRALYTDLKTYLPGDILVKVDRMSMANSLECRAPLLDYRIVEYAASLPMHLKWRNGTSKYILKKSLGKLLPESILHRKKMGFESPIAQWLRSSLKVTFEQAVFNDRAANLELFNQAPLKEMWNQHQAGSNTYVSELWSIFMFELWWQQYMVD